MLPSAALVYQVRDHHLPFSIKSRADALANLPDPARWFPKGDVASRQRMGPSKRQPSSEHPTEGFSCLTIDMRTGSGTVPR